MTIHELNSKVHLPSLARIKDLSGDISYQKIPGYGWFGYNKDLTYVFDAFDITCTTPEHSWQLYRHATIDRPDIQDYKMRYSEVTENKLRINYERCLNDSLFYKACKAAAQTESIRFNTKNIRFTDLLAELGYSQLIHTGIGLITPKIQQRYTRSYNYRLKESDTNKLVIPTFYAPGHIASLEICTVTDLQNRRPIWQLDHKGWYGELNRSIVSDVSELVTNRGCTWSPLIDYWADKTKPVMLSDKLTTEQCIGLWGYCKNLTFTKSPLEIIKNRHELGKVKNFIKDFNLPQIKELEKMTGEKLSTHWQAARSVETSVFGLKFTCANNRYYVHRGIDITGVEFTNFAIELDYVAKEKDEFWQYGFVDFNDQEIPFRLKSKVFSSHQRLMKELTNILLEAGAGMPTIAPSLKHYLINVIFGFNQQNSIGTTQIAKKE